MAPATLANNTPKRKRVVLTVKQKIDICNKLDKGARASAVMREYNIGSSTLYDIRKQKEKLLKYVNFHSQQHGKQRKGGVWQAEGVTKVEERGG